MATPPPSSSRLQLSLKGITSTNVDPELCAACSKPFPAGLLGSTSSFAVCCGKRSCNDCRRAKRCFVGMDRGIISALRCLFCNAPVSVDGKTMAGSLKKHAKKGAPWAQFFLGDWFELGANSLPQSDHDAKRWYEKAAKQGHPEAMLRMGPFYLKGSAGCTVNLSKARELAEKAMSLDRNVAAMSRILLLTISHRVDDDNEAKSILMALDVQMHNNQPKSCKVPTIFQVLPSKASYIENTLNRRDFQL